ncbi:MULTISPECIES: metallophosphoesterase [unclassified Sphingomonas]|uniref:metallophosphoesterase family protein n=2 Tax=Sphingomonas TaxID=13687 RepID=UPI001AD0DD93|nr:MULTISPECIES: metallophosphoesterase [unclassified Sphingomonas]MBN8849878.1 metallophosphoesterase [Sphingomonas sp.]
MLIEIKPRFQRLAATAAACLLMGAVAMGQVYRPPSGATPSTAKPFLDAADGFRFAIVSDRTGGARPGVFERAIDELNLLRPEFVISVGDLVEGYRKDPAVLAGQWREFDDMIARLDMRFFRVAGNHDLSNDAMLADWRKRAGNPYYSFVYKGVLFLVFDTDDPPVSSRDILSRLFPEPGKAAEMEQLLESDPRRADALVSAQIEKLKMPADEVIPAGISEKQANWARQTLAAHRDARWTMIFMHKPAWLYRNDGNHFPTIQSALAGRRYTVFAGHEHYYQHEVIDGHDYFRLGTTGGEWMRKGPGSVDHIAWVTVDKSGAHVANIRVDGVFGAGGPSGDVAGTQQ